MKINEIKQNGKTLKDLRFYYTNGNNERVVEEYRTIMDFTDRVESGEIDASVMSGSDVHAFFFENEHNTKWFQSVKELYDHCVNITK